MSSPSRISLVALATGCLSAAALGQGLFREHDGGAGDRLGRAAAGVGDLDHDGCDDYAIASPYEITVSGAEGVVRIHSGRTGNVLFTFEGDGSSDDFGWDVDGAGDVDADGTPDVIVGAIGGDSSVPDVGMARVYSGATGAVLYTYYGEKPFNQYGSDVEGMGDVDLDGHADFAVSSSRTFSTAGVYPSGVPGIARLYSGKTGAMLFEWTGLYGTDAFGSLAALGDVNGDGRPDVGIGAWGPEGSTGYAFVYSGLDGSVIHSFTGAYVGENFGFGVAGVGDVDGDGRGDIAISSPAWDAVLAGWPIPGSVSIRSGATGAVLQTFHGSEPYDLFGSWLVTLGDATGDGVAELAVAASPFHADSGLYAEAYVRVISLASGAALYDYQVDGETPYDLVAFCADAGDVNGDGFADLIVGDQVDDDHGYESGEAKVLWVSNASCGTFQSIGTPCAAPGGSAPTLTMTGCPTAGGFITLSIQNGKPNGLAFLCLGLSQIAAPIGGGCSWYLGTPLPVVLPLPLSGFGPQQGSVTLSAMLPLGTPPFTLFHQAIVLDPAAILGFTTTNAVRENGT